MPRTLQQLKEDGQLSELIRTLRGEVPGVPNPSNAGLARRFGISESTVEVARTAAAMPAPKAKAPAPTRTVTEAGEAAFAAPADGNVHKQYLASRLSAEVNAAEARIEADGGSLAGLSLQQLEALAADWS